MEENEVTTEDKTESKPGIRVFVYGSLKRGHGNNWLLDHGGAEFLGLCLLSGKHKLVDLGYYPGLVPDHSPNAPEQTVLGEVWRVDKDTLDALDQLEGHPDYYARCKVQTPWKGAWAYYLPTDYLARAPLVPTLGDAGPQVWRPSPEEVAYASAA